MYKLSNLQKHVIILASAQISDAIKSLLHNKAIIDSVDKLDLSAPVLLIGDSHELFNATIRTAVEKNYARIIFVFNQVNAQLPTSANNFPIFGFITQPLQTEIVDSVLNAAWENLTLKLHYEKLQLDLNKAFIEIDELNKIGAALSAERDTTKLLEMILQKSREITTSDAGALYLVEDEPNTKSSVLRFALTQNDSVVVPFNSFTIPIDKSRISSYAALTGKILHIEDAYNLPPDAEYGFSKDFDVQINYRTKSILAVPMQNHKGEVIGVLQLLNHKINSKIKVTLENADEVLQPYPEHAQQLVNSLASQAAVALENNRMIHDIQKLFEGFVQASVMAIEARDPTTSGHSFRVEKLTVALAEAVNRTYEGAYADIKFTKDQIREISYASILHDFGKVGVREHVLVKANKLYPFQLKLIQQRFNYIRKAIKEEHYRNRLNYLLEQGKAGYLLNLSNFDNELAQNIKQIDDYLAFILVCNNPSILPEGNFEKLQDLAVHTYLTEDGKEETLLNKEEVRFLSITRGSLDETERAEIESHVIHTFNFLSQIPWTKELSAIPEIARSHHEKLNGTGYPYKLFGDQIPIQSRMIAISDIFDALSAADRPYKRALSPEKSLDILGSEVKRKLLDEELYRIFVNQEIWKVTTVV